MMYCILEHVRRKHNLQKAKILSYLKPLLSSQGLCRRGEPAGSTGHQTGSPWTPHHIPAGGGGDLGIGEQAGQQALQA